MNRNFIYLLLFVFLFQFPAEAQEKQYKNLSQALGGAGQFAGKRGPASVNWINEGTAYSFTEGKVIKSYNPTTQKETIIFDGSDKMFPDIKKKFAYVDFQWSKDSKYILFQCNFRPVWRRSGVSDYYKYDVAKKQLDPVAKNARTAELSPDGKMVGYEREGNLFVYEFATDTETQLTTDGKDEKFFNGRFGWAYEEEFGLAQAWIWSPDSKYIAYWQSDEREVPIFQMTDYEELRKKYTELPYPQVGDKNPIVKIGVLDIAQKTNQFMDFELGDGYIPRLYWTSKAGQLALVHLNRKQNHLKLLFGDTKTGKTMQIMEEKSEAWIDVFDFFAGIMHYFFFPTDSEEFFWISDRDGYNHIYRYDYTGKLLNQVTQGNWEVVYVYNVDSKKKKVYYSSTENSPLERQLYSVDFKGKKKKQITKVAGRHTIEFSPNSTYFIDTYSNVNLPRQVELWSVRKGKIKTLVDNQNAQKAMKEKFYAPRELMQFTTTEGHTLDIYLIKPANFDENKKYPLVLNIYGGPGAQSVYNEFASNAWEQYLAQEGYVIASVNNRGSGGYGAKFKKVVYSNLGEYEAKDFVETVQFLAKKSWVDGENMAIRGHSYGGYMSSFTTLNHPDIFKVAIVGAPVTDWRLYDSIYAERYMGLASNEEAYKKSSSTTYAQNLKGKMLLVHSTMDENVHVQNTFQLMTALTEAGKDVDLRIYPKGAHGVAYDWASYVLLYQTYVDYLEEHLKN